MVNIKKDIVADWIISERSYGYGNPCDWIVIHETANTSRGANASMHARLQSNFNSRSASWHYQVDEHNIIQSFPDRVKAWHAGGDMRMNLKSIGIEICVNSDGDYNKAVQNAVELTKYLMNKYNIPSNRVIQHHKASDWGKNCPRQMRSGDYGWTWNKFKNAISGGGITVDELLSEGDSGYSVRKLQNQLIKAGYKLPKYGADGGYGNETVKAVKQLQRDYNLLVDGVVGESTRKALKQALEGVLTVSERKEFEQMKKDIKQLKRQMAGKAEERQIKGRMFNMFDDVHDELDEKVDKQPNDDTPWPSHAENVQWAKEIGVSNGKNPHLFISREQTMSMLKGLYDAIYVQGDSAAPSHDDNWQWAIDNGITNGGNPHHPITREQVVTMLKRYDELNEVVELE